MLFGEIDLSILLTFGESVLILCGFRHGGTYKVLRNLLKNKLVHHDATKCESFMVNFAPFLLDENLDYHSYFVGPFGYR